VLFNSVIGIVVPIFRLFLIFNLYHAGQNRKKNDIFFYPILPALVVGCGRDNIKKEQVLAEVGFEPTTFGT